MLYSEPDRRAPPQYPIRRPRVAYGADVENPDKKEKSGATAALYSLRSITYAQRITGKTPMKVRWGVGFVTVC